MATAIEVTSVDEGAAVATARAKLEGIAAHFIALERRLQTYTGLIDPHVHHGNEPVSVDLLLEARAELPGLRVEHLRAIRELHQAEAELDRVRALERDKRRQQFHERKRGIVARLARTLADAAAINDALMEVEAEQRRVVGDWHLSGLAWPELNAPTPTQPSRLDDWRQAARAAGLLDD